MKKLDWQSAILAAGAGGLLLIIAIWLYDQVLSDPSDPLMPHAHLALWGILGAFVGLTVQSAERLSGVS